MSMSVCKFDSEMKGYTVLYDCIPTIEDAELLAQLAMIEKRNDELIFIFPGWNRGINEKTELYNKALVLANEYKFNNKRGYFSFNKDNVNLDEG